MRVVVDQPIGVGAVVAQEVLLRDDFYEQLSGVSPVGQIEVLAHEVRDGRVVRRVRLRFSGRIDPPASRIVDPEQLTWVQETETDLAARRTTLRAVPDRYGWLLGWSGWYELRSDDPGRCTQHLDSSLQVRLPGLGRLAERAIARGLREHLAAEAELIERLGGTE